MSYEDFVDMSKEELLVEIDEIESERDDLRVLHEEAVKSRDNLSVELERVKAEHEWMKECLACLQLFIDFERDATEAANEYYGSWSDMVDEKKTELTSLKSRLPVNRDGDVVLTEEDIQWVCVITEMKIGEQKKTEIRELVPLLIYKDKEKGWCVSDKKHKVQLSSCHSTSESCRENGGGE